MQWTALLSWFGCVRSSFVLWGQSGLVHPLGWTWRLGCFTRSKHKSKLFCNGLYFKPKQSQTIKMLILEWNKPIYPRVCQSQVKYRSKLGLKYLIRCSFHWFAFIVQTLMWSEMCFNNFSHLADPILKHYRTYFLTFLYEIVGLVLRWKKWQKWQMWPNVKELDLWSSRNRFEIQAQILNITQISVPSVTISVQCICVTIRAETKVFFMFIWKLCKLIQQYYIERYIPYSERSLNQPFYPLTFIKWIIFKNK